MSKPPDIEPPIILLGMTAFIFREAILRAQTWGAFRADQFHREKLRLGLKLFSSVVLIAALPLLAVAFFWEIAETATGEPICQYLFSRFGMSVQHEAVFLACRTTLSLLVVFAFSLFPKGMKHIWVLVARIFRWVPTEGLPTVRYSLQAVLLCALSPLIIAFCLIPGHPLSLLNKDYWSRTFFLGYAAELVVLYKIGAQREFFKTKEEWISSWRMLRSLAYTVAAPLAFGWIAHRIVEGARSGRRIPVAWLFGQNLSIWGFVGSYALLFLFLTVPLGFNQTYLLWAHKYTQSEEVREGSRSWWKLCFVFVFAPPLLASAIWYWF